MTDPTLLKPGQTMAQLRREQQLLIDCDAIVKAIDKTPGISGKNEIASETGLSAERVADCIRHINANETGYSRVDYGTRKAKEGRYAGLTISGWWPMRVSAYVPVMDQADEHSALVERGVRLSRLVRLAFAHGLKNQAARDAVASIEARLTVQIEELSEPDLTAFESLLVEELNGT